MNIIMIKVVNVKLVRVLSDDVSAASKFSLDFEAESRKIDRNNAAKNKNKIKIPAM